jgi:carboxyl-terminal processing protease
MARWNMLGLLLVLATGGLLVWAFEAPAQQATVDPKMVAQYDRFIEIVGLVQKQYVRDVDTKKMFENAINGMLNGLDPFSNYIPEEELAEFNKQTRGKFGGIGIQIGQRKGLLTVISPIEETPAFRAGVLAGDLIVEIDGKSAENIRLEEAVKILTGEPGTKVRLKVRHMTGELEEFTITRAIIEVQTVKGLNRDDKDQWNYWIDPEKKIAYVRLTGFTEFSTADLRKVLDQLEKEGMQGLILDLRFNPGGILKTAIDICDMFIDQGVIVQTKGRVVQPFVATATGKNTLPFCPMVVMINPFSASASEIVSGCLQDHHRAIIVGERSFGKGSVQNVIPLEGEKAALKLTTAKYYLPSGRCIHRDEDMTDKDEWGVMPDIAIPMTPEDYIGIIRARQDAEIIHKGTNGQPKDATKTDAPKTEAPKTEAPKTDKPRTQPAATATATDDDEDVLPGAKAGAAKPAKPFEDRQLLRSVDLLRAMEVMEKYKKDPLKVEVAKPRETKKAA